MSTLEIDVKSTFTVKVSVQGPDKYTGLAPVKFTRQFSADSIHGANELFLTPEQVEEMGMFLVEEARRMKK
jgi:hypothetical protein